MKNKSVVYSQSHHDYHQTCLMIVLISCKQNVIIVITPVWHKAMHALWYMNPLPWKDLFTEIYARNKLKILTGIDWTKACTWVIFDKSQTTCLTFALWCVRLMSLIRSNCLAKPWNHFWSCNVSEKHMCRIYKILVDPPYPCVSKINIQRRIMCD